MRLINVFKDAVGNGIDKNHPRRLILLHITLVISPGNNMLLAYGFNCPRDHSEQAAWDAYRATHKNRIRRHRNKVILINLAIDAQRRVHCSRPCMQCSQLIVRNQRHIERVWWSTRDGCTFESETPQRIAYGAKTSIKNYIAALRLRGPNRR